MYLGFRTATKKILRHTRPNRPTTDR
jgi:hypothetical protein